MKRVLVLAQNKQPLMPCHPARARQLLQSGRARVFRAHPFTLILIERTQEDIQHAELNLDPGSKTTGIAIVVDCARGRNVFFAAHLSHRGQQIKQALEQRRAIRRSRRHRKTRYRQSRFNNRTRAKGWLAPSLLSRVNNVVHLARKLQNLIPLNAIAVETVRFDMQKLVNPEISGVQYQQGTLQGYEVREYLLEKWQRQCAYCQAKEVPLEIEHIVPRAKGGSHRVTNLVLACVPCNQKKGSQPLALFLRDNPKLLQGILSQTQQPLKDAASVNSTRIAIGEALKTLGLPVHSSSGGRTKYNRTQQSYCKEHWIDAACVGERGHNVAIVQTIQPLLIQAYGRGSRQMCRVDRYGFPRTTSKQKKVVQGFKTGDLVKALVTTGKKQGAYRGRVAVRASGNFNIKCQNKTIQGIRAKYCHLVQKSDGYHYTGDGASSLCSKQGVSAPIFR